MVITRPETFLPALWLAKVVKYALCTAMVAWLCIGLEHHAELIGKGAQFHELYPAHYFYPWFISHYNGLHQLEEVTDGSPFLMHFHGVETSNLNLGNGHTTIRDHKKYRLDIFLKPRDGKRVNISWARMAYRLEWKNKIRVADPNIVGTRLWLW